MSHFSTEVQVPRITSAIRGKISKLKYVIGELEKNELTYTKDIDDRGLKFNYRENLNDSQYLACTSLKGQYLVIAGAGSGKTHTMTMRASYMLEKGINPHSILMITFTRKATEEMRERIEALVGKEIAKNMTISTFHGFCNTAIAKYGRILGIPSNYNIIDPIDCADALGMLKKACGFKGKGRKQFPKSSLVYGIISKSRNLNTSIRKIMEKEYEEILMYVPEIEALNRELVKYKRKNLLLDYDDLISYTLMGLKTNREFRKKFTDRYKYITVDECQDINANQQGLINELVDNKNNLMCVGDDTQSIYGFRGADYESILRFGETYRDGKIIKLKTNYRSNVGVVDFINCIADKVTLGYDKDVDAFKTNIHKPVVVTRSDEKSEAEFILTKIKNSEVEYKDMAVIYRSSMHGNFVQAELVKSGIPYRVLGGLKFMERRHVRDVLAYLRVINNPYDAIAWHRVLKLIYGIGDVYASKIAEQIFQKEGSVDSVKSKSKTYGKELEGLMALIKEVSVSDMDINTMIDKVCVFYKPLLEALEPDWKVRMEDIVVLKKMSMGTTSLTKFINELTLDPAEVNDDIDNCVTLTTVHSSKGLEWDTVFVVHCLDGLFPHQRSLESFEQVEEERRLFYVACSRAKENLYVTTPSCVATYSGFFSHLSRFVLEVPSDKYSTIG